MGKKKRAVGTVRPLISLDWALKRVLRNKANFGVLEGFLTELLESEVTILEVLESESNQEHCDDKSNRVDLKVKLASGEIVIVEVQVKRERDFLQRMLYATSRVVTEHMDRGAKYLSVVKVISVNVVYFPAVAGSDYVYRGTTTFRGLHGGDELHTSRTRDVFPTYYLLQMDRFDNVVRNTLDEWLYLFNRQDVPAGFTAKGLAKAKEVLDILALPPDERRAYERGEDDSHYQASMEASEYLYGVDHGLEKGHAKGLEQGREEGRGALLLVARRLLATHDDSAVAALTGLTPEEVARLRAERPAPRPGS